MRVILKIDNSEDAEVVLALDLIQRICYVIMGLVAGYILSIADLYLS